MPNPAINKSRLAIILLLSFSSGLPLALTGSTLQAWFTVSGISITAIGALSLVGQPYVYKFLWAPLLDRYVLSSLGRRRSWLVFTQILLLFNILAMAFGSPDHHPFALALLALFIATLSATQDMAVDAYRTEITPSHERGLSSALYTGGYRTAMLVSGGLALILADVMGWRATYLIMAALMSIGLLASWFGREPVVLSANHPKSLYEAVIEPLREFLTRPSAWLFLLLILFYKFGDALSISLTTPFLIRGLGFSLTTVGAINKGVGLLGTLIGVLIAGALMTRLSMYRALFLFGVAQLWAILTLLILAIVGKNTALLIVVIFLDNFCNGMGTTALVAFLMALCDQRYTATQFALLSAVAATGRVFIGPLAGVMVEHMGWAHFFIWSFFAAFPGLFLVWWLKDKINQRAIV